MEARTPVQRLVDTMLDRAETNNPSVEYDRTESGAVTAREAGQMHRLPDEVEGADA